MRFYGYFRSSAAYRCRIAFNIKQLEPEFAPVHLRRNGGEQKSDFYKRINPQGLVPALVEGDLVLTQSLAIIEWLDETYPDPPLLPGDRNTRAIVRAFAQIIACDIHPLQNLRVLQYLRNELAQEQSGADDWCMHWIGEGLAACEKVLERHHRASAFCFGDTPTLADVCLAPQIYSADRFGVATDQFPIIAHVRKTHEQTQAFSDAHPMKQPDAEVS